MRLVHSEVLQRDEREMEVVYTSKYISEIFKIFAVGTSIIPLEAVQWEGRRVILDYSDIPHDTPIYITYFSDESQHSTDIISINRMVDEVYNKFGGRRNCDIHEDYIKEKLIFHINYLNRTKINEYYNKQFCFKTGKNQINSCVCLQSSCGGCVEKPPVIRGCACADEHKHEEGCTFSEIVEEKAPKKRFVIDKSLPQFGMLRLQSGEFVRYSQLEDGLHLESQHNIDTLGKFSVGYWIPSHDILSVAVDGKKTTNFDIEENFIFIKEEQCNDVCIEYVEKYSECNIGDKCVKFDSTFWKLPVFETIVELAVDSEDTRVKMWNEQLQKMKKDYTIIISRSNMNFDFYNHKITNIPRKYNGHNAMYHGNRLPFTIPKICNTCNK